MKKYLFLLATLIYSLTSYSETIEVTAQNYSYTPSNITVNVGDTVIWINNGGNHDVNGNISAITGEPYNNPESFDSDNNNVEGEIIYSHVFNVPGEYNYDCSVGNHALQGMVGTINIVQFSSSSSTSRNVVSGSCRSFATEVVFRILGLSKWTWFIDLSLIHI